MGEYNFNNFQLPATGLVGGDATGNAQGREFGMKISNFRALDLTSRDPGDYTKNLPGYKFLSELQNPDVPEDNSNENPLQWGSTVKWSRSDELTIMTLGSRNSDDPALPRYDVSDTKLFHDTTKQPGQLVDFNYPTEGYRGLIGSRVAYGQ
jgi:hypothetical protein